MPTGALAALGVSRRLSFRTVRKWSKRIAVLAAAVYFIPTVLAVYVVCGFLDFIRNRRRTLGVLESYFAGNGFQTWFLSPFNLFVDVVTFPYWNKRIYELADLPPGHQDEINSIIETARQSDLVGKLNEKMGDKPRGLIFFKWYGKNVETSVTIPEFHRPFKYIRTIGVSIFNKKQSTGKHFGTFRVTLRVLYNINDIHSDKVYIKVGKHINYWRDKKLFIFDDTLQHQSCNESDAVRYCMFVDILRPSLFPRLMSAILTCVRTTVGGKFSPAFAKNWVMIR
jgi:aspartyl/asparaginyl beta-hydroxylase (cupin superfamily)